MKPLRITKNANDFEDEVIRRAFQYEKDILNGIIPAGKKIIKAIERSRKARLKYNYNEMALRDVAILFYLMYIPIKDRPTQFLPDPWQCWILLNLFAILKEDGTRLYNEALILVARKSGKTMFVAAITIAFLFKYRGMSGQLFGAATTQKQASQLVNYCKVILRNSPQLKNKIKYYRDELHFDDGYSLHVLSQLSEQQADKADGSNPSFVCYDEGHSFKNDNLKQVCLTGMGARNQPLFISITTAGFLTVGYPLYEQIQLADKVLDEKEIDERTFYAIYQLDSDEEAKNQDINTLIKANPGLGTAVSPERLNDMRDKALLLPTTWKQFLVKNANIFQSTIDEPFISLEDFEKCMKHEVKLEDYYGCKAWIGYDLSQSVDMTALTVLIEDKDTGELNVYVKHYFPSRKDKEGNELNKVVRANGVPLTPWIEAGYIEVHKTIIDLDKIYDDIIELCSNYDVQMIGYDPHNAQYISKKLEANYKLSVRHIPVAQSDLVMNQPTRLLEKLVISEKINLGVNPVLKYNNSNCRLRINQTSNLIRVIKDEQLNPIDSIISTIVALAVYDETKNSTLSIMLRDKDNKNNNDE